jgi:RHS repeat-associated protein
VATVTDAAGGVRRFAYDLAGRLTEAVDPLGGVTRYAYHPRGWLTSVTDPLGATTTRTYDEVGRPVTETDPLGRVTTFRYDAAGRRIARVDGAGREVRWSYDASGRVVAVRAGDDPAVTFERDALGRPVDVREPGSYRHRLRWDRAGRLVERRRDDLALRWEYGPDGERTALVLPDGTRATYAYDDSGRLTGLRHPLIGALAIRRDEAGRMIAADGDRVQATWEYTAGRLTAYRFGDRSARLRRDGAGRVTTAMVDGADLVLRYDAAGQLTGAGERTFGYDAAGRLTRDGDIACAYDAAGQLRTRGGSTYDYDASGRRIRENRPDGGARAYRWNGFGRLTAVDDGDHRTTVAVDALGELAEVDGQPVLWDGEPCWLGDRPVLAPWTEQPAPDWQGTHGAGRDVWGAPARTEPGLGFRGELEFAGLTWLRHRVYEPSSRAFLSPDPLSPVPGTAWSGNPYHYAGNDPVGRVDPSGLRPVTDAELRAYRDEMGRNAWEKTTDWVGENWEYLAAGAMIVGGVALMFTGVGGPAGVALMAASGGLIAGGASAGIQKFTTGEVDWGQVAKDGLVGAAAGGLGAGAAAAATSSARLAATNPLARELLINGVESVVSGGVERAATGGDIFNPRALATDLLTGGAAPAPGNRLGGASSPPPPPPGVGVDANPIIQALDHGQLARLDAALAGRVPVVSPQAASEYLSRGTQERFDEFMLERNGRVGSEPTEDAARALRERASQMEDQYGNRRSLGEEDSRVVASAMQDQVPLITNDRQVIRFLENYPYPVEPFR